MYSETSHVTGKMLYTLAIACPHAVPYIAMYGTACGHAIKPHGNYYMCAGN